MNRELDKRLNQKLPEYIIPNNSGSITLLLEKKLTNELKDEYEKLLGLRIYQDDVIFLQVWQGDGTTNCHTIPILKTSEVYAATNTVIKISNLIKGNMKKYDTEYPYFTSFLWDDWKSEDEKLCEFYPENIKIFTLVGLALIYMKSYEDVLFYMGAILDKLIEKGKEYKKINTRSK